ncbi:MAG: adenylate/guanylate cyclase domain-containing protein [Flavobacteriaceae bacterium]|nr:MAG: adenylate/guanylate cyclase domain-containing protein [Flavobacteriaceae bacterium]
MAKQKATSSKQEKPLAIIPPTSAEAIEEALENDLTIELISSGGTSILPQLAAARPANQLDTTPLDLDAIIESVAHLIATTPDHYKCIMFTDLVGSTQYKREMGHTKGFMRNRMFCDICEQAVIRNNGTVVKRLGDGIMAVFETAIDAVLAAMLMVSSLENDRKKLKKIVGKMDCRIGITCGYVKEIPGVTKDYIGHAMDKGARIEGIAKTNQVLIDEIVYGLIHTKIRDYSGEILIGAPKNVTLKGVGVSTLYEVSPKDRGLVRSASYKLRHMFN